MPANYDHLAQLHRVTHELAESDFEPLRATTEVRLLHASVKALYVRCLYGDVFADSRPVVQLGYDLHMECLDQGLLPFAEGGPALNEDRLVPRRHRPEDRRDRTAQEADE